MNRTGPPIACVTGASGMIGRRIVKKLVASGYQVRGLGRGGAAAVDDTNITLFRGNLEDGEIVKNFLHNAQLLFHCAAELTDTSRMWAVNVRATEQLLHLAHQAGIEYLCYLSSAGVVGKTDQSWVDETVSCNPQTQYELSKWQAEKLVIQSHDISRVIILRPTNVIDENRPGALGPAMRRSLLDRLQVLVKGGECAHVIHAEDVAAAALYSLSYPVAAPACFFVSCDHEPLNTFAGLWAVYSACKEDRPLDQVAPPFHLPLMVPYLMRRLWRGPRNRGDVRYSSQRLLSTGFTFPLGLTGAVKQIISRQPAVKI